MFLLKTQIRAVYACEPLHLPYRKCSTQNFAVSDSFDDGVLLAHYDLEREVFIIPTFRTNVADFYNYRD